MRALLLLLLLVGTAEAGPGRVDIEVQRSDDHDVVPVGRRGLIVAGASKGGEWTLSGYDTALREVWTRTLDVSRGHHRTAYAEDDGRLTLLLSGAKRSFTLIECDLVVGDCLTRELASPVRFDTLDQVALDASGAWLAGAEGRGGVLLHVPSDGSAPRSVDIGRRTAVQHLRSSEASGVEASLRTTERRRRTLRIARLESGGIASETELTTPDDVQPYSGQLVRLDGGRELVVGTWSADARLGAQGLYVATFSDGGQRSLEATPFSALHHFYDYLPARQQERAEARARRRASTGRVADDYRLLVHDVVQRGDGLVLVAEAYLPVYHTYTTSVTTTTNGVTTTTTTTHTVWVGWRFTHALVAGLTPTGAVAWDHSFPIEDVLTRRLAPQVRVVHHDGDLKLIHAIDGEVRRHVIRGDAVVEERVDAALDGGRIRRSWATDAAPWYDDVFLVWGLQKAATEAGAARVFSFEAVE